ncbi:hypothetical protein ACFIQF_19030 [Comamonas sp. J-3]|uniref:hypothetical protein n=1 Tax=Comamonas trifloxystrobinivorans TaxID=3350256 RepID=UPI00372B7222
MDWQFLSTFFQSWGLLDALQLLAFGLWYLSPVWIAIAYVRREPASPKIKLLFTSFAVLLGYLLWQLLAHPLNSLMSSANQQLMGLQAQGYFDNSPLLTGIVLWFSQWWWKLLLLYGLPLSVLLSGYLLNKYWLRPVVAAAQTPASPTPQTPPRP